MLKNKGGLHEVLNVLQFDLFGSGIECVGDEIQGFESNGVLLASLPSLPTDCASIRHRGQPISRIGWNRLSRHAVATGRRRLRLHRVA
jgi:hypothetical protein